MCQVAGAMGFMVAIAAPSGNGSTVGGGQGALLNQHGFGGDSGTERFANAIHSPALRKAVPGI